MDQKLTSGIKINGVELTELRQVQDPRGAVLHMLRSDSLGFTQFGECYFSEVLPGAIKAWKRHLIQTQNIAVPVGRIRIVIFDDRKDSETYKQLQIEELGRPDKYLRIEIPPKLWYGFTCISEFPALLVNCPDIPHDPLESEKIDTNYSVIPYKWAGE